MSDYFENLKGNRVKITRQWVGKILSVENDSVLVETDDGHVVWVSLGLANGTIATVIDLK